MAADALVLGANGTFGHVAARVLTARFDTIVTARSANDAVLAFDVTQSDADLRALLGKVKPGGMVLNAVATLAGEIPPGAPAAAYERALAINAVFPHRLARIAEEQGQRVVQISTDAVFPRDAGERDEAGVIGPEDFYGLSKAAGEISGSRALTIRCSLIGPPAEARSRGLWSWIASEAKGATVRGYTNQLWSGLTTLQLAEVCAALVDADAFGQVRRHGAIHHLAPNATLSKYEVVRILASVVRPDLKVAAADGPTDVRRVLVSRYGALDRLTPRYDDWDAAIAASFQEFKRQHEVC